MGAILNAEMTDEFHIKPSISGVTKHQILEIAGAYNLIEPTLEEVRFGRDIAACLIDANVAPADAYLQIQRHAGVCPLVYREDGQVTGMMAMLLLNIKGHVALRQGCFNAHTPSMNHLSAAEEPINAGYGWGFAATTKEAGRAVVGATDAFHRKLFHTIDCYTRAATPDGVRVLRGKLGYTSVPWPDDTGLIWIPGQV